MRGFPGVSQIQSLSAQVGGAALVAVQVDATVGVVVAVASLESVQSHQGPGSGLT
jgi:hypothetical protein